MYTYQYIFKTYHYICIYIYICIYTYIKRVYLCGHDASDMFSFSLGVPLAVAPAAPKKDGSI